MTKSFSGVSEARRSRDFRMALGDVLEAGQDGLRVRLAHRPQGACARCPLNVAHPSASLPSRRSRFRLTMPYQPEGAPENHADGQTTIVFGARCRIAQFQASLMHLHHRLDERQAKARCPGLQRLSSSRTKRLTTSSRLSAGMPGPWSATESYDRRHPASQG